MIPITVDTKNEPNNVNKPPFKSKKINNYNNLIKKLITSPGTGQTDWSDLPFDTGQRKRLPKMAFKWGYFAKRFPSNKITSR
ncbi:hypothetical protein [Aeromonas sobria]|uniref:hypothetical protein n=1 Tax=Aeromonas sobria TaxID=646 RepID=UPI0012FECBD4|nr:hypothetical protein [Aeromonas sobria]